MKNIFLVVSLFFVLNGFSQDKFEVFFDFNKDVPNEVSISKLNQWITTHKNVEVDKIAGYCDSIDDSSYNKKLSSMRINSVIKFLNDNAIVIAKNVELQPLGKDFKQSKNQSENRKVVFYYKIKNEIIALETKVKNENTALETKVKEAKKGDLIKLNNIYFLNNSPQIVSKSEATLFQLLKIMRDNPKLKIEIQGHICCKKPSDPDVISEARAKAIYDYLVLREIKKERLTYKGYGVSKPVHLIPEKNTKEEDENRRVEIMILEN
jgi:outer membrane protein OmpA-like peptidoglycan-associated protein